MHFVQLKETFQIFKTVKTCRSFKKLTTLDAIFPNWPPFEKALKTYKFVTFFKKLQKSTKNAQQSFVAIRPTFWKRLASQPRPDVQANIFAD